jgi:RluA family pseudouridine synthase
METILESKISPAWSDTTLIVFLSSRFKYHSESEWQKLIFEEKVLLNNNPARSDTVLRVGDVVSYHVVLREPPVNTDIRIVYEDDELLVASKPPNLPSHADGNFITHTCIYLLNQMMREKAMRQPLKLVNRLDRETSGLIVASKNRRAHKDLARQFEAGKVHKEYIAIARGEMLETSFEVDGLIVPDSKSKISIRRMVGEKGTPHARESKTSFEVLESLCGYTVVRCIPHTGRTAQIRVHLAHRGYPLAGDKLYGRSDEEFLDYVSRVRAGNFEPLSWMDAPRQMLHAHRLIFLHPASGKEVACEDPLPDDMQKFIKLHRKKC